MTSDDDSRCLYEHDHRWKNVGEWYNKKKKRLQVFKKCARCGKMIKEFYDDPR